MTGRATRAPRTAALAAVGLVAGPLALAAPPAAHAAPADDPVRTNGGPYVNSVQCLADGPALPDVTAGVSDAQRELRWAELASLSTGEGVTVAVIDSGVNPRPALAGRLVGGGDLVDPAHGRGGLVDCDGHGTVVAGIIAAAPDTTTGFVGVAPRARVLAIRQASSRYKPADTAAGRTTAGTRDGVAAAIDLAVARGAKVINISSAACAPALQGDPGRLTSAVQRAAAKDVVVVASAGNVGEGACSPQNPATGAPVTAAWPARIPQVLAVGAVTSKDAPADYSLHGPWVDVAAPGDHLLSINPHPSATGQVGSIITADGRSPLQGTSFSAPIVTGVAALVRARFPRLSAEQVVHRIVATASHPAGARERNDALGYGVVSPRAALTSVLPEEGDAGRPSAPTPSASPAVTALPAPAHVTDDPLPRQVALAGSGLLALGVVAFALVRAGRHREPDPAPGRR